MKQLQHSSEISKTLKTYIATYAFSVTSLCYMGMEARRRVKFTGAELTGGAELAALVEKATVDPVEKVTVGSCAREARGGREARWRGRKTGSHALAWSRYQLAERRHDGERGAVESAVTKAAQRSTVAESYHGAGEVSFSFLFLERLGANGWADKM
jgi:hypothetical protein